MDPKHLKEARILSRDAFKQATERFLASKKPVCDCGLAGFPWRQDDHFMWCASKAKDAA